MTDEWVSAIEAAERLHLAPKTIRKHLRAGTLPLRAIKIGNVWRIDLASLDATLAVIEGDES